MKRTKIAPTLLCADCLNLMRDMGALERGGAGAFHIDVMDGHFVPNLGFTPDQVRAMRARTDLPLDVHLMAEAPERWLDAFPGASSIAVHLETTATPIRHLRAIRAHGQKAGVAINPATPEILAFPAAEEADFVLVMAVEPGFSGQTLIPAALRKVEALARFRTQNRLPFEIEVDGGLTRALGRACVAAGADALVAGALCLFSGAPLEAEMRGLAEEWRGEL